MGKPSSKMLQAAVLEAHGQSREVIARTVGAANSTVRDWRNREDYQAEVERVRDLVGAQLETTLDRVRTEVLDVFELAIAETRTQLEASDDEGRPLYGIRANAVKLATEMVKAVTPTQRGEGAAGAATAAAAAIIVVDRRGEVVEGTVTGER